MTRFLVKGKEEGVKGRGEGKEEEGGSGKLTPNS
jgi:hypothetical protein